jgi:hypothetical protein
MPDKQLYHLTIGYKNGQSIQALTYMDRKAIREQLAAETDDFELVHLSCQSSDGDPIDVDVYPHDIQLLMVQKFEKKEPPRVQPAVPRIFQ